MRFNLDPEHIIATWKRVGRSMGSKLWWRNTGIQTPDPACE